MSYFKHRSLGALATTNAPVSTTPVRDSHGCLPGETWDRIDKFCRPAPRPVSRPTFSRPRTSAFKPAVVAEKAKIDAEAAARAAEIRAAEEARRRREELRVAEAERRAREEELAQDAQSALEARAAEANRIAAATQEATAKKVLLAEEAARVAERSASASSGSAYKYPLPSAPIVPVDLPNLPGVDLSSKAAPIVPARKSNTLLIAAGLGLAAYLVLK